MSTWERAWTINNDPKHVYRCGIPLEISLTRKAAAGITYYEVTFKKLDCPEEWDNCWLVPRGTIPCVWDSNEPPLPPWKKRYEKLYREAIVRQLSKFNMSTKRLEGELDYGFSTKTVYFFLASDAVQDPRTRRFSSLLIVVSASNLPWNCEENKSTEKSRKVATAKGGAVRDEEDPVTPIGQPIEDGTAHGNPK